ncbi:molybdenum cofactor guanylyltransferase [Clostridium sp. WLY-B-L2]|jgi:molybdopterin-guanine dinucleotide biosynthesis protein A|uniref:Probable molybdenum cofactor guanylyltransferase n=1 Tax=Clostridium aromativorans TaxID=2836848 RepID=A0ABS8N2S2_9CLOT|nr:MULTISPECIES: molybdenum cofactor guanylyltransferase [Clostridium]KAA8676549.1 molybdenum cofactor guanylyltransferase [Clostridium sp. HV4-5-A1G]MCC9294099.1 molybdenum cofactor guanylyltransferase [Clostridium aromativorans]CAB1239669.1 putative molybdenum cofactor guanylyltransferase [Clostridiaceae bacterium BL-3]
MEKFKTAVILAGGKSSRMGFDKQFIKINEKRLLEIMVDRLKKEFDDIIIVTNKPERYAGSSCRIVCDEIKQKGPLSGIHIGLKKSSSKYVYFVACDMPNINIDYIRHMKEKIRNLDVDACITKVGNRLEHFNAFYSRGVIKNIENLLLKNCRAVACLTSKVNTFYIEEQEARRYSPDWNMFLNINTKKDLDKYINSLDD